MSITNSRQSK